MESSFTEKQPFYYNLWRILLISERRKLDVINLLNLLNRSKKIELDIFFDVCKSNMVLMTEAINKALLHKSSLVVRGVLELLINFFVNEHCIDYVERFLDAIYRILERNEISLTKRINIYLKSFQKFNSLKSMMMNILFSSSNQKDILFQIKLSKIILNKLNFDFQLDFFILLNESTRKNVINENIIKEFSKTFFIETIKDLEQFLTERIYSVDYDESYFSKVPQALLFYLENLYLNEDKNGLYPSLALMSIEKISNKKDSQRNIDGEYLWLLLIKYLLSQFNYNMSSFSCESKIKNEIFSKFAEYIISTARFLNSFLKKSDSFKNFYRILILMLQEHQGNEHIKKNLKDASELFSNLVIECEDDSLIFDFLILIKSMKHIDRNITCSTSCNDFFYKTVHVSFI